MKLLLAFLMFCAANTFAQGHSEDSKFRIKSIEEGKAQANGLFLYIECKVQGNPDNDQTVMYSVFDKRNKPVFWSLSNQKGQIVLSFLDLKDSKYLRVGGIGDIPVKINLTDFKGKSVQMELEVKQNMEPLYD